MIMMSKIFYKIIVILILLITSNSAYTDPCYLYDAKDSYLTQNTIYGAVLNELIFTNHYTCILQDKSTIQVCDNQDNCQNFNNSPTRFNDIKFANLQNIYSLNTFALKTQQNSGQLCLTMQTINGDVPITCMSIPGISNATSQDDKCYSAAESCFMSITSPHSKLLFNFSGRVVQCAQDSMSKIFFDSPSCPDQPNVSSFYTIAQNMRSIIAALLTLYIIGYGIKILTTHYSLNPEEYVTFILKFIMVVYFSVGMQFSSIFNNTFNQNVENGMTDIVMPILTSLSSDLSQMVFDSARNNSQGTGLCSFNSADYDKGYGYYALFDMIDCRIGYFLGYGLIYDSILNGAQPKNAQEGGMLVWTVLSGLLLGSPVMFVVNVLFIYLFFTTLIVNFLGTYVVYIIFLYTMMMISPIFIPMVLFKQTSQMFSGWFRLTLSFALQPAIMAAFIAIILTIYDQALYGDCKFQAIKHGNITTFEIIADGTSNCTNSYGYQLYRMYMGDNWQTQNFTFFAFDVVVPEAKFILPAFQALIVSFIIYKFALISAAFAAAITGGISLDLRVNKQEAAGEGGNKSENDSEKSSKPDPGASDKASIPKGMPVKR